MLPSSGPATHGSMPQQLRSTVSSDRTTTTKAGTKANVSVVSVSAPMASRVHHTESNPVCLHSCGRPYFCEPRSFCSLTRGPRHVSAAAAYTQPFVRKRRGVRVSAQVCVNASVCVYASAGCVYAGGCAFTRALGMYTQRVRIHTAGCVYAGRCVYASGGCLYAAGAYTPPGAYTRAGAFTRAVGVYTQRVRIHTRVRIRGWVRLREWWVRIRSGCIYAPGCVYAGRCESANGGCVYTGGVYTHPLAYTQVSAYTHPRLRLRRNRRTVMHDRSGRKIRHMHRHAHAHTESLLRVSAASHSLYYTSTTRGT